MSTILLHPTYFPSITHMAAIAQADHVVFEMEDNYQKQTYRNRAYIAHSNGKLLLNVPVKHSHDGSRQKTKNVAVENDFPWQSHHLKSLQSAYRTSPFFEFYEDELTPIFTRNVKQLMEHNLYIYEQLFELIGMDTQISFSETYEKQPEQLDFRFMTKAKREKKITIEPYTQVFIEKHGFLNNLSILDLLVNEGPNALTYLERQELSCLK